LAQKQAQMNALTKQQNNAATGDAASVFLFALPLGSVFGADVEGELATVNSGRCIAPSDFFLCLGVSWCVSVCLLPICGALLKPLPHRLMIGRHLLATPSYGTANQPPHSPFLCFHPSFVPMPVPPPLRRPSGRCGPCPR